MTAPLNLVGRRFGRLTVISRGTNNRHGQSQWEVYCDCGKLSLATGTKLVGGHTKSCGCLIADTTRARCTAHGQGGRKKRSRAYNAWKEMNRRIRRDPSYTAKGVTVCEEWRHSFEEFYKYIGDCPDKFELDRIDNSKGYEPNNVRWASETIQSRNRTYCRMDMVKAEAVRKDPRPSRVVASEYGVSKKTILDIRSGRRWVPTPVGKTVHIKE